MSSTPKVAAFAGTGNDAVRWPALTNLGLSADDLTLLRRQGFLEWRARGRSVHGGCWRLRYRRDGSLKTVYVGTDNARVNQLKQELFDLQAVRRRRQELQRAERKTTVAIRQIKQQLSPVVRQLGLHFHGDALRKFRYPLSRKN